MNSETQFYDGGRTSFNPVGYTQSTVTTTVVTLTPPGVNIRRVIIRVSGGKVRFRDDGGDPTQSLGFPILADETMIVDSKFTDLRFIKDISATSITLDALWYN